jgi:hypothetical protein
MRGAGGGRCSNEAAMLFWLVADAIGHSFGLVRAGLEVAASSRPAIVITRLG